MAKKDVYEVITEKILTDLESMDNPWVKPWVTQSIGNQRNGESKRPYTGINALVLATSGRESANWFTFNQINKRGLRLKKGSKSVPVIGWFKTNKKDYDSSNEEEQAYLCARFYKVFNAFDIEDCPEDLLNIQEIKTFDNPRFEDAEDVIFATSADIHYGHDSAFYRPMQDTVHMPNIESFLKSHEYYSTMFHELGHWTGNSKRLDRFKSNKVAAFRSTEYSREELVAELCSVFVCSALDITSDSTYRNSVAYLQGWGKFLRSDAKAFVVAAQQAQKAADYILNAQSAMSKLKSEVQNEQN